jgi:putative aldouronate transport system permease protein
VVEHARPRIQSLGVIAIERKLLARRRERIRDPLVDRVFMVAIGLLLTAVAAVVLLPLIYILASSFSSPQAVSAGRVTVWPVDFTVRGYQVAFANPQIVTGFANSLFYTIVGALFSLVLTVAIAFPLSRKNFFGGRVITLLVIFTMLFQGGLIPTFIVVKSLGMLDTRWAPIVPQALGVWQVLIATAYFRESIPEELYEAAQLDGASDLRFLWSVALPLSKPMLAVVALMYGISQWNAYFDALIYLKSSELYPLQLVLRDILILNTQTPGSSMNNLLERRQLAQLLKYSLIVISTVPVMLIYPFVARYFTKGILLGAVKG